MTEVKKTEQTFDLYFEGNKAGLLEYNKTADGIMEITHTEVSEKYSGHGLGKELVRAAVDEAKENKLKIRSTCPYASKVIEKNPDYKELLVS